MQNLFSQIPPSAKIVSLFTIMGLIVTGAVSFTDVFNQEDDKARPIGISVLENKTFKPIEGAEIIFRSLEVPAKKLTNSDGYINIDIPENIRNSSISIHITKEGYKTEIVEINLEVDKKRSYTYYLKKIKNKKLEVPLPESNKSRGDSKEQKPMQTATYKGYCTFISINSRSNNIVNDICSIYDEQNGNYKLIWSDGKVSNITTDPSVSIDNTPGTIIKKGNNYMTIKWIQGNTGFCWNCTTEP